MAKKQYSIHKKMQTVWKLREKSMQEVSAEVDVPTRTIRKWQKNYDAIKREYEKYLHDEGIHRVLYAQKVFAEKIIELTRHMTEKKMQDAPLNQIISGIGVLVDRFLRIHDGKEIIPDANDNRFTIEYYDATTGKVTDTPPWAGDDSGDESALHSSFLWQTLWQNRTGETNHSGNGSDGQERVVARTHVSDGESGLARPKNSDDERDWYPD